MSCLLLVEGKADAKRRGIDGCGPTPLFAAAGQGHLEVGRVLLTEGKVVVEGVSVGATPLSVAAQGGHFAVCRLLLTEGQADPTRQSSRHHSRPYSVERGSQEHCAFAHQT